MYHRSLPYKMIPIVATLLVVLLITSRIPPETTLEAASSQEVSFSEFVRQPGMAAHAALADRQNTMITSTNPATTTLRFDKLLLQQEGHRAWLPLIKRATSEQSFSWRTLINARDGYSLRYPSTATAVLHKPEGVLHVRLSETQSTLLVLTHANPEQLALAAWLDSPLNVRAQATSAACTPLTVQQQDACAFRLFGGDHWNAHVFLVNGKQVYELIYPEGDQAALMQQIVATFHPVIEPDAVDTGFQLIDLDASPPMLADVIADLPVPYFNQGDPQWGSNPLGTCSFTIGSHGCAITSLAMLFNYYHANFTNPGALNQCLIANGGYTGGCNVYWSNKCMPSGVSFTDHGDIDTELRNQRPVIVGVDGGAHWVVIIGKRSDGRYNINNPSPYPTSTLGHTVVDPGRISYIRRYSGTPPISIPTGGYDEPANGTFFRSQITLRGHASDARSGVNHVNFTAHYDGNWHLIATDHTAPYEYTWDASGLADQEIILGFDIYNKAGNVAYSPEGTRTIIKDATLPTGGYDAPAHQAFIGKEVQLAGHASDNLSGVAYVNFTAHYNGSWHVIGTDHEPPYAMTWNTAGIADQSIILGFDIYDRAGNVALAPEGTRTVTKDTTPPTGTLNTPVHQSATSDPVFSLEAEASDALSGVATVSFHASYDGAWHELGRVAELPYTFTWDASALADQRIVFSLHATDRAGNTLMLPAQRVREVMLDREAPVVTATLAHAQPTADHTRLPIHLTTTDLSGAHEVRVSLDGVTWEAWQPLASPFWWQTEQAHGTTIHPFIQVRDRAGNRTSSLQLNAVTLDFYPPRPTSTRFRLAQGVISTSGGTMSSSRFQLNGTSGQTLASSEQLTSARFQASLGYWATSDQAMPSQRGNVYLPLIRR